VILGQVWRGRSWPRQTSLSFVIAPSDIALAAGARTKTVGFDQIRVGAMRVRLGRRGVRCREPQRYSITV